MHLPVPAPRFVYYLSPPEKLNSPGLAISAFKIEGITVAVSVGFQRLDKMT